METKRGKDTSGGSGPLSLHVGLLKPFRGALKKFKFAPAAKRAQLRGAVDALGEKKEKTTFVQE